MNTNTPPSPTLQQWLNGALCLFLVLLVFLAALLSPAMLYAAMTPPGNALTFNGTSQYVNIPDADSLDMTTNYTLECWFKADSFGTAGNLRGLISKYQSAGANGYLLRLNGTELDFDGMVTSGLNLQAGRWYHVAAVNNAGTRHLYVNGVEKTISGTGFTVVANTNALTLGSDFLVNNNRFFAGQMDEVRIWNTARTQADIQDAMHHVLAGSETGLVAYHQFDQSSGTSLPDLTANGNTGTLVSSPTWTTSTVPLANAIASRTNIRGAWSSNLTALASSRLNVANATASGSNFALFGHDNATDAWQTADVPAGVGSRLTRVWRTEVSGSVSGNVVLDTTGLSGIGDGSELRLLVDGDGVFSNATAVSGSFVSPYFTVSGQSIAGSSYYTLGKTADFTDSGITLPGVNYAWHAVAWGDYDNDGLLDFVVCGDTGSGYITRIYHNNGYGTFSDSGVANLPGVVYGAAAWGDYDGDGYLDLALSGNVGGSTYITRIYHNNGNGTFSDINAGLPGAYYSSVAWGDYDNDGRPDLLVAGNGLNSNTTRIFHNNGDGTFTDSNIVLPGIGQGQAAWGDFDNDGRLDIVVHGGSSGGNITRIYRNNGDGTFTDINAALTGETWGSVAWGDYNNDGKLDLLISGSGSNALLYRNNGYGSFTEMAGTTLGASPRSSVAWGDYDNEGNPDILLTSSSQSSVYHSNGSGGFTNISAGLPTVSWGGVAWGDYDNDGRLDFLFTTGTATTLYHNTSGASANTPPAAPGNLQAVRSDDTVTFSWDAATDSETPAAGLSYNLRVGTASGKNDAMPAMADSSTGFRRVAALGNVQMNRSWTVTLAPGKTYYWSVQAIDGAFAGGAWASEVNIILPHLPAVTTTAVTNMTATSAQSGGNVTAAGDSPVTAYGVVWNSTGSPTVASHDGITTDGSGTGSYTSAITGLTAGHTYYVRAYATSALGTSYGSQVGFVLRDASTALIPPSNVLHFNGTSQYVEIANASDLQLTQAHTLELWFKADSVSGTRPLVSKFQTTGVNGWSLELNGSEVQFDGMTTSGLGLTTGTWYHLAAVNSGGSLTLYVNGTAVALTGTAITVLSSSDPVRLGYGVSGGYFQGQLDEVRIWSRALSAQDVHETMHLVGGGATGLVAYYDFDATSGTTLTDGAQAATVHNGTLTNMAGTEWTRSTIPAGSGSVNTQAEAAGTVTFTGTNLSANFSTAGSASLSATRINADLPRGTWPADLDVFSPWFVVDRFGTGSFNATLTVTVSQGMDASDQATPSQVGLYQRSSTSDGAWTLLTTATSVNAATQTAVFPGVTTFGQLAVVYRIMQRLANTLPGGDEATNVVWGDFNNDGKLDLAINGGLIYRNDGSGSFSDMNAGLSGNTAWVDPADYNNDGSLDLALLTESGPFVYSNNGSGALSKAVTLPALSSEDSHARDVAWGDYNNDGRPDLLVIGTEGTTTIIRLYRNDGNNTFTEVSAGFDSNPNASAAWGDYDKDGYLDLVITGDAGAFVYHNNGNGAFTKVATLPEHQQGNAAWGDYDNDGWLDLLLTSAYPAQLISVYRNNQGNGAFSDIGVNLSYYGGSQYFGYYAHGAWGDYDNDGRLDILLTGASWGGGSAGGRDCKLIHNNGDGTFSDFGIDMSYWSVDPYALVDSAAFGDDDNDGRLDVAVMDEVATRIYHNNYRTVNTAPTAPTGLSASVVNGVATLSWNAATDNETPSSGLSYNLRIGTAPGEDDVMAGMADTSSGFRRVPALGNVGMNRTWTINGLTPGRTYYWSVQAVDTGLMGGAWATEGSFHDPSPSVTTASVTNISPTTADSGGNATNEGDASITGKGLVWNTSANPTVSSYLGKTDHGAGLGSFSDTMTSLTSGQTYYVRAYATNSYGTSYGSQRVFAPSMTPPGHALSFSSNGYVSIADANDLDMTTNYSLEVWFKADSFGGLRGLISKYQSSGANGYLLRLTGTDLDFDQMTTTGLNLQTGMWYHVAAVNDNGTRHLYVNGVERTLSGTATTVQANHDVLCLADDYNGRFFAGTLDEARIWNVARTQTQIRDNMHKTLSGDEANLVAFYRFDHLSGTALVDLTANNNEGTLTNMTDADWVASTAPIGNDAMQSQTAVRAIWTGGSTTAGDAGLIFANGSFLQDAGDDMIFGHNNLTGNTSSDLPTGGGWDAGHGQRWQRVWYLNKSDVNSDGGNVNVTFDFGEAGMNGLPTGGPANYRLLERAGTSGAFSDITVVSGATGSISGDQVLFSGVNSTELGSCYTLGTVDKNASPTAVTLRDFGARPGPGSQFFEATGFMGALAALGAIGMFVWALRRQKPGQRYDH